jgi:hypothetical protein
MSEELPHRRTKQEFQAYCLKAFGIPAAILQLVIWGHWGTALGLFWAVIWWIFLIFTGYIGAVVFATIAWPIYEGRGRRSNPSRDP